MSKFKLNTIEEAIEDIKNGKMIIVVDDEDRENEGDESPMTNHPPSTDAQQLVVVGGAETTEFHRQSQMYVNSFNTSERQIDMYVVPNVDHFDELNVLADPGSIFFNKICAILGLERTNR